MKASMLPVMQQVKIALSTSTSHGLTRIVSNKPIYVRITWLLLYLLMLVLFLKGFFEFIVKLKSERVTTSIESEGEKFQFPDVYMCFENPISGSYSGNIDASTAAAINGHFSAIDEELTLFGMRRNLSAKETNELRMNNSFLYVFGLPYKLLIDALSHRVEQSVISSNMIYIDESGAPTSIEMETKQFNHPLYLRCLQWTMNSTWQEKLTSAESWSGLTLTLLLDINSSFLESKGFQVTKKTFIPSGIEIPMSDWSMSIKDFVEADRVAGAKVFLSPPGEFPSDFVSSFSLGPGKYHSVEIEMTRHAYTENQFECLGIQPEIQFVNPYDLSPYSHKYSYSYCYFHEYHRLSQQLFNLSGQVSPLPWSLRNRKFLYNLTGTPNYGSVIYDQSVWIELNKFGERIRLACMQKRPCSKLDYSASISSADWPTQTSLAAFINSSVRQAWTRAKARDLSVPALDFLMTGNVSSVASYVSSNLLKVRFKPRKVACDRITFSIDYGFSNFISEVGGIMGIYLGMSLLTLCELFELLHNLIASCCAKVCSSSIKEDPSVGSISVASSTPVVAE